MTLLSAPATYKAPISDFSIIAQDHVLAQCKQLAPAHYQLLTSRGRTCQVGRVGRTGCAESLNIS